MEDMIIHIPEDAVIRLSDGDGHLLEGASIVFWVGK